MPAQSVEERLAAVERALADGEQSADGANHPDLAERLDALEAEVADLEAGLQAVRGYVGSVKAVNDEVEQRADAALATAARLERAVEASARRSDGASGAAGGATDSPAAEQVAAAADPSTAAAEATAGEGDCRDGTPGTHWDGEEVPPGPDDCKTGARDADVEAEGRRHEGAGAEPGGGSPPTRRADRPPTPREDGPPTRREEGCCRLCGRPTSESDGDDESPGAAVDGVDPSLPSRGHDHGESGEDAGLLDRIREAL